MGKTFEEMMAELHTLLQESLVATPRGSRPTSIVELMFPGIGIEPEQYEGMEGSENPMCALVDEALRPGVVYAPVGSRFSAVYGQILKNTQVPQSRPLTREEQSRYNVDQTYISHHFKEYIKFQDAYNDAVAELRLGTFPDRLAKQRAQNKVNSIMSAWKKANKQEYETREHRIRELLISSPAAYFGSAADQYDSYGSELAAAFYPSDWHREDAHLGWTRMDFDQSTSQSSTTTTTTHTDEVISRIYHRTGVWATICGWFGHRREESRPETNKKVAEETNSSVSYESMSLHFEAALVSVSRPWLDLGMLGTEGTMLAGYHAGGISSGELSPDNAGALPGYATGFILARNMEMEMKMSKEMADYLQSVTNDNSKESVQCGPFKLDRTATVTVTRNSNTTASDLMTVHISAGPQKQVIGFVTTVMPRFPARDW